MIKCTFRYVLQQIMRKKSLKSDGQQFHQYQQNEQSHISYYFCIKNKNFNKIIANMSVHHAYKYIFPFHKCM
jgi:hypothetical protein